MCRIVGVVINCPLLGNYSILYWLTHLQNHATPMVLLMLFVETEFACVRVNAWTKSCALTYMAGRLLDDIVIILPRRL